MRRLRRPRIVPPTLRPAGRGGQEVRNRESRWLESRRIDDVATGFPPIWGEADVRGALYAMHGRGCAYCQRNLPGNDRGDVEHFRPKNIYWWLAYDFENYFLSCTVCNSAFKINRFPTIPENKNYDYDRRQRLAREPRGLIDPATDPVDDWMTIDFDFERAKRHGFRVLVRERLDRTARDRCETTIRFFKFNIEPELLRERQMTISKTLDLLKYAVKGDARSIEELKRIASCYKEHGFVVRQVIVAHANRPDLVPTYEEEVRWLVEEFVDLLRFADNAVQVEPKLARHKITRDRYAWALAVLLKDPPALDEARVRAMIPADLLPLVDDKHAQL